MEFQVRPLRHYDGAHYPSPEDDALEPVERSLSLKMLVVFFALAVAFGLMACVDDQRSYHPGDRVRTGDSGSGDGNDGDYDILLGTRPECLPGEAFCNHHVYAECTAGRDFELTDCDAVCQDLTGMDAIACDASRADPCQCDYGMLDGGLAIECVPGDLVCAGNALGTCDHYVFDYIDCDQYCRELMGTTTATSQGCDATDTADPCTCVDEGEPH